MPVPELTDTQKAQVIETLTAWGRAHPGQDKAILQTSRGVVTPRSIAENIADPDSGVQRVMFRLIAAGLVPLGEGETPETRDDVLNDFRAETKQWLAQKNKPRAKGPKPPRL